MGALVPKPPAGFPFHVGLTVMLAGGVAAFAAENHGPLSPDRLYAGSLGAAIFLLAGPLTEALVAHRYGPRARVDLWRAVQFAAVLLGLATWVQLPPPSLSARRTSRACRAAGSSLSPSTSWSRWAPSWRPWSCAGATCRRGCRCARSCPWWRPWSCW